MKRLFFVLSMALVVSACTPTSDSVDAQEDASAPADSAASTTTTEYTGESFAGTIDAPEFPEGLDWVNTDEPLTLNALKGKVVLLDFWTYGCVNCIHILPDLERLEAEYADELVVIGVHSAKFPNEGETENLRDIVQRYEIAHPVVNDKDFAIWSSWGANAWPTIAVIDPASRAVGIRAGEGVYEAVEPVIAALVAEFDAAGAIDRRPVDFSLEAEAAPDRPLRYPGKVLAREGRLFVSDTGHHRVLEIDPATGAVLAAFGSGERGAADGPALEATFNSPQGLELVGDTLYVADTNNHLIRAIDLESGDVTTAVGTGQQGWPPASGRLLATSLATPWDIEEKSGSLYIANAGTHQIWRADLPFDLVGPLIGNARESTINGPFGSSELAQPSSVTISADGKLYFADSESSSIRVGDLGTQTTSLVVGADQDLFTFGDEDGVGNQARLQHPLGTAVDDGILYVADTYNSKIKRVDLATNEVTSWLGAEAGWADGDDPRFNEPGGLSLDGALLYVADTNNHAIRVVDTETGLATTLVLKGIEDFDPPAEFRGEIIDMAAIVGTAGAASLVLDYQLPDGHKVNEEAPSSIAIASGGSIIALDRGDPTDLTGTDLPATVPITLAEGSGTAEIDVTIIWCSEDATSLCFIDQVRYRVPMEVGPAGASTQITLSRAIETPTS